MVDRDVSFGPITVRFGNVATWCGRMLQPASSAGVQILSYSFNPGGGTAWSQVNPALLDLGTDGSGLVAVGTWLQANDSLVVFYRRLVPPPNSSSSNHDALAVNVVPYALDPADEGDMVAPCAIGSPSNATILAHRQSPLWFDTDAVALPSVIDLNVLTPIAGWPSWANARPTMAEVLPRWAGYCGELWAGSWGFASRLPYNHHSRGGYGHYYSGKVSDGMMMALSTEGTAAERKELARRMAQWGVDLYGAYVLGRNDGVDGGHYQGRKALIVWAGHFLDKPWVDASGTFGTDKFNEDEQFYTTSPKAWAWTDRNWTAGYKGKTESPTDLLLAVNQWGTKFENMLYLTGYFQPAVGSQVGTALAMQIIGRTTEMGTGHRGMVAQFMEGPGATNLAAIDAIVITCIDPRDGQVFDDAHPREILWGYSDSPDGYNGFGRAAWTAYNTYAAPSGGPEIEVSGLSNAILDGDSTPTVVDGTNFGTVQQGGSTVTSSFVVTNIGDEDLVISNVTVPTGFTNTGPSSGTLPPGFAAVLTVRLDAATAGTKSGDVTISSNDANEGTYNFAVLGVVNAAPTFPNIQVTGGSGNFSPIIADGDSTPSSVDGTDFGFAPQTSVSQARILRTFNVANAGDATLTISGVTVPSGFTVTTALPASLAPGASAPLVVGLDLATVGTKSGDVSISSNDPDAATYNFAITGTVSPSPNITVTNVTNGAGTPSVGDNRNFGNVAALGTPPSRSFVVNNTGTGALSIVSVTIPSGFTVTTALDSSIAAASSDTLIVQMDTDTEGVKSGNIVIETNDPEEPLFSFGITGDVGAPFASTPPQSNGFFLLGT